MRFLRFIRQLFTPQLEPPEQTARRLSEEVVDRFSNHRDSFGWPDTVKGSYEPVPDWFKPYAAILKKLEKYMENQWP